MSRVRTLLVTILPSMITGGLLFGSAPGHAESGRDGALGFWPEAPESAPGSVIVAQADPWIPPRTRSRGPQGPMVPPVPPVAPVPPPPPLPPRHGHSRSHGHGMSVSIHDGRIEIDGIEELVQDQLERVADVLDSIPDMPPDVRDRIKARVKSVRDKVGARLGKLKSLDLDKLGPEMERMGDEIEKDMEGLDKDLEQFGDKFGKSFAEKFGKDFAKNFIPGHIPSTSRIPGNYDSDNSDGRDDDADDDDDDKDAAAQPPAADPDMADPDMRVAVAGIKNLTLDQNQKDQLAKLRADTDRQVAEAKRELEAMSDRLHDALGDLSADEADITRQIDLISQKEATIRKARVLAWVRARSLLDPDQRKKVEAAARKRHR